MCEKNGIPEKVAKDILVFLQTKIEKKLPKVLDRLSVNHPSPISVQIANDTLARIKQLK